MRNPLRFHLRAPLSASLVHLVDQIDIAALRVGYNRRGGGNIRLGHLQEELGIRTVLLGLTGLTCQQVGDDYVSGALDKTTRMQYAHG